MQETTGVSIGIGNSFHGANSQWKQKTHGKETSAITDNRLERSGKSPGIGQGETSDSEENLRTEEDQKQQVAELKKRDREVRSHEMAHVAAGASSPSYKLQSGPDGRQYAVGGSTQIDTSSEGDPEADLTKARKVRRAALAPANPSQQDRQVAASASKLETEARVTLTRESRRTGIDAEQQKSEALGQPTSYLNAQAVDNPPAVATPVQTPKETPTPAVQAVDSAGAYDRNGRPVYRNNAPTLDLWA